MSSKSNASTHRPNHWLALLFTLLAALVAIPSWGYNIEITGVEVSQGTQNMDNDMPLVMGRRIIVRAYARETTGQTIVDVEAHVYVTFSYKTLGGPGTGGGGGGGLNFTSEPATITPMSPSRLDYSASLNTEVEINIPTGIDPTKMVDFAVEVTVNEEHLDDESNPNDNFMIVETEMQVPNPLRVKFVPVHLHQRISPQAAIDSHLWDSPIALKLAFAALRHHPIALDRFTFTWSDVPVEPVGHAVGVEWDMGLKAHQDDVLARLGTRHMMEGHPATTVMSGMVAPAATTGTTPRGQAGGFQMWHIMDPTLYPTADWYYDGSGTVAHELGHLRGVEHVLCKGDEPNPDPNYPWPKAPGGPCQLADIDEDGYYGLDVYYNLFGRSEPLTISNDPSQSNPHRGWPLMGYWRPMWVSPYETCRMMNFGYGMDCDLSWPMPQVGSFVPASVYQLVQADEHIWIGGLLDALQEQVFLTPFYRKNDASQDLIRQAIERRMQDANGGRETRFTILLKNANGGTLYKHPIYDRSGDENSPETLVLNDLLPFPAGTATIEFLADGRTIAARAVSASAPSVQLSMPSTASLGMGDRISWQGSDVDSGSELTYSVLYGFDTSQGGDVTTVWETLKLETRETELVISADHLASLGGEKGRIKVVVSDGVNSSNSISGTYATPNPPPKAWILNAPREPAAPGAVVVLEGLGLDRDDGILPRDALTWSSDLDGALGTGERIEPSLSPGAHSITLTVIDSQGGTDQATAELIVSR